MILHHEAVGQGPVVVLLHGFPFDHTMWDAQKTALAATHRVIVPDLRGHGRSTALAEPSYGVDAMADDVMETIESLGIAGPIILGGLSMGGYVALSIAARYPTRLRGLLLLDTRAGADTPEARANRLKLAAEVESAGSPAPAVEAMLPKLFASKTRDSHPEIVNRMRAVMMATPAQTVAATLRGLADRPDRTGDLDAIAVPTLVIVGAEDALTPPAEAHAMGRAIPESRVIEVAEAGHLAPVENPEAVNHAIADYLAGMSA